MMAKIEALIALANEIIADTSLPLAKSNLVFKLISEIGWKRTEVYITNIVKRRPSDNRDPLPEEIESYKPYLARQIEIIKPKIIATLGRFSMNYFLPQAKITRDEGKLFQFYLPGQTGNYFIYPLFHPAAALRSATTLEVLRQSFQRLPEVIAKAEELAKTRPPSSTTEPSVKQESLF
ncbi:MAG: uracil-DNA glycosylase [Candidatus Vogelbacteria bacterium]